MVFIIVLVYKTPRANKCFNVTGGEMAERGNSSFQEKKKKKTKQNPLATFVNN